MPARLDADVRISLEEGIVEQEGVLHASVDPRTGGVWVVRDPEYEQAPIELAVRNRIAALGHDPAGLDVRVTVPMASGPRRRVRFVEVDRVEEHGRTTISVSLEWNDEIHTGAASGERGLVLELRSTAQAAIQALERLSGQDLQIRIIGVKMIHAFDSDLMVTSLVRTTGSSQRLVGAVIVDSDPHVATALAVLSALNRTMGNFLHTPD
jgi:hypothetical protein